MLNGQAATAAVHPIFSFWLDASVKVAAVLIGGLWTGWNYIKSRTYEQKLELEVVGTVFIQEDLYGDMKAVVKNIGAGKHAVQHEGTFCELSIVRDDLTEQSIRLFRIFTHNERIEPGESISDTQCWRIARPLDHILWAKLTLRVVSNGVEWNSTCLIRVEKEATILTSEVI